ncbi:dTDP-4-dehydrorhamnose 3,5-epimerase family protein [Actinomadura sediminis]|uniref:dTDP-4-dehydrorhamnose 3,5-epimerase family protein n=1 Tax=Actinomadura sediminis TaxID=1038904 RepID=A0ABW3EKM0_9ACTN
MQIHPTEIEGVHLFEPRVLTDARGRFLEIFTQADVTEAIGHRMPVAQVNCSVSRRGTIRGLHAVSPPGQARYVTCVSGAVTDIVVDVRPGSPTFGRHVSTLLDEHSRHAVYMAEGLAHGFACLTEEATVVYLSSSPYDPGATIRIDPLDPELGLDWRGRDPVLSDQDRTAPRLREVVARGLLSGFAR